MNMAKEIYDPELRKLAKRANQRIRRLEESYPHSPALESVQAALEMLGADKRSDVAGRRFSETGKAMSKRELNAYKKAVNEFLSFKTSTKSGYKSYRRDVWESAKEQYNLKEKGITEQQYFDIWKNLPAKKKDRIFGSDVYILITNTVLMKQEGKLNKRKRKVKNENVLTVEEIEKAINSATTLKEAYKAVGISWRDINKYKSLDSDD